MPKTLPLTAPRRLKRRLVDFLDWLDSIALLEENVLSGPTAAGLTEIAPSREATPGLGGGPTLHAIARWSILLAAILATLQCLASGVVRFTAPHLLSDQPFQWTFPPLVCGLSALLLLRSQLLYALLFGMIGAIWGSGTIAAVAPDWLLVIPTDELLLISMILPLAIEWPALVKGPRAWLYRAVLVATIIWTSLILWHPPLIVTSFFYAVLVVFVLHTERFFFLGWRRTLRTLSLVITATPYVVLAVLEVGFDPDFKLWTRTAFYFMLAAPAGSLLYEWAYRRRRNQSNLRGGSA